MSYRIFYKAFRGPSLPLFLSCVLFSSTDMSSSVSVESSLFGPCLSNSSSGKYSVSSWSQSVMFIFDIVLVFQSFSLCLIRLCSSANRISYAPDDSVLSSLNCSFKVFGTSCLRSNQMASL